MALKNLFKNKKQKGEVAAQATEQPKKQILDRQTQNFASDILKMFLPSEKSQNLQKYNQYVFVVDKKASKPAIRRAVEMKYGVKVESVNVINYRGKTKRWRTTISHRPDFKKAIVSLKAGEKIEIA
jgi:large subunit ribosomal protein L23